MTVVIKIGGTGRTEPDGAAARPSKCGRGWGSQAGPHQRYSGGCGARHAPARPGHRGAGHGGQAGPADPPGGGPGGGTAGTAPVRKGVAMRTLGKPEGAARRAALGGSGAAAQPSPSGINPGGVMIGPGPSKDVALCRAIPKLTRMVFMLSTKPPNLHVREVLPAWFPIKDRATVRELATLLCGLPAVPAGRMICPDDMGASYRMFF